MTFDREEIEGLGKVFRLNLINSITGIKPANLIGTKSKEGISNLAIISSLVHLGSNPPLLGFIMRPSQQVRRDTYDNIIETGYYTINHFQSSDIDKAHYTSAKFESSVSEFETCEFSEEYLDDFQAPYVGSSICKIGMKFLNVIPIEQNGVKLIIGEVQHIYISDDALDKEGQINLEQLGSLGISGLNSYYSLNKLKEMPYARVSELPKFS